jgi:hypothetical protein
MLLALAVATVNLLHVPAPGAASPFRAYLADASVTGIESAARSHGLRCGKPWSFGWGGPFEVCERIQYEEVTSLTLFGPDARRLAMVSVLAHGLQPADRPYTVDLFQAVVGATVASQDAPADVAWLSAHVDQAGTSHTALDGVTLQLTVTSSHQSLSIHPTSFLGPPARR